MAEPATDAAATARCAALSAERDEQMLGTAFAQPGVLLVEQPGPWGHAGLAESRFDPDVARALEARARDAGLRLLAIRRPGAHAAGSGPRRWAVLPAGAPGADPPAPGADSPPAPVRAEHHRPRTLTWSSFTDDAELLDVPLDVPLGGSATDGWATDGWATDGWATDGWAGRPDPDPLYLVCAHSKRDVCCALRGRPLAADLAALRPGRVWECSHTGGHRFAPNVLVLPLGALYGRVPEGGAAGLVATSERGEVIPALLRGLTGHPPVVQVALGHLLARLDEASPAAVTVRAGTGTGTEIEPGRWLVRLAHAGVPWRAVIDVDTVATPYASCGRPEPKLQPRYTLRELTRDD